VSRLKHAKHASPKAWDESVAELTRLGKSSRYIAERLGITQRTVQRARARTGTNMPCDPRSGRRYTPELLAAMEQHLDDGWSYAEIGRTYGVDPQRVSLHFPGRGWTIEQSAEIAVARKREIALFRVLDNQHHNATHLMPLADVA
jgi:hypothetical protein